MLTRAKITSLLKGEWAALNLFDKGQLVLMVCGLGWGAYAITPELAALQDISARLGPKVESTDTVFVGQAGRDAQSIYIELQKVRSEGQLQYEVWMCSGEGNTTMTFFGSGHLGKEQNSVRLIAHTEDNPSELLVNLNDGKASYTRRETWDLYRGMKQSATEIIPGTVLCGEV